MQLEVVCDAEVQSLLNAYFIHIDKAKFAQVVRNLVSNAIKFTPREGSVTVLIEALPASDDTNTSGAPQNLLYSPTSVTPESMVLRVSVTDTGAGISQVIP